jgi:hypothetical protein
MKNFHASFLYPLALVALSFAPAFAGGRACMAASTAQKLASQERVDQAVAATLEMAKKRLSVVEQLREVQVVVDEDSAIYIGARGECLIASRLAQEIAELRARAHRYLVHESEVAALQREIVFARLERAINEIERRFANGDMAEDTFTMAVSTLQLDAFTWLESQGMISIRERLQNAISALQQAAGDAIAVLHRAQAVYVLIYEARLTAAAHTLREHVAAGKVTKQDYLRFEALSRAFDLLVKSFAPYEC